MGQLAFHVSVLGELPGKDRQITPTQRCGAEYDLVDERPFRFATIHAEESQSITTLEDCQAGCR